MREIPSLDSPHCSIFETSAYVLYFDGASILLVDLIPGIPSHLEFMAAKALVPYQLLQ